MMRRVIWRLVLRLTGFALLFAGAILLVDGPILVGALLIVLGAALILSLPDGGVGMGV